MTDDPRARASRPGPSTPARTPTRPPGRPSCRSTPPPPTPRRRPASTRATSTRAAATRRAPPWRPAWPSLEGGERGLAFASGLAATTAVLSLLRARRRGRRRGRPLRRHLPPARTRLQAVGPRRPLHRRPVAGRLRARSSRRRRSWSGSRRRPTRCCRSSTSPPSPSWPTRPGRCWRSTTPSPRRTCSSRSQLGADLVVHSTTKYLGGHSDVVGGAVIGRSDLLRADRVLPERRRRRAGAVRRLPDAARPQDAGRAHGAALRQRPRSWPTGWPSSRRSSRSTTPACRTTPATTLARRQMRDFGGMISVRLKGGTRGGAAVPDADEAVQPGREPGRRRVAGRATRRR